MTVPHQTGSQVVIRERYPILRWIAGFIGLLAGHKLGQDAGFYAVQARGISGNED
jgi:hypothetical protein